MVKKTVAELAKFNEMKSKYVNEFSAMSPKAFEAEGKEMGSLFTAVKSKVFAEANGIKITEDTQARVAAFSKVLATKKDERYALKRPEAVLNIKVDLRDSISEDATFAEKKLANGRVTYPIATQIRKEAIEAVDAVVAKYLNKSTKVFDLSAVQKAKEEQRNIAKVERLKARLGVSVKV